MPVLSTDNRPASMIVRLQRIVDKLQSIQDDAIAAEGCLGHLDALPEINKVSLGDDLDTVITRLEQLVPPIARSVERIKDDLGWDLPIVAKSMAPTKAVRGL